MGAVIHGKSHSGIKYFREKAAALSIYWIYCSRTNWEGVAWPSLRGLAHDTNWSADTCADAREWLVNHQVLERVENYIRPKFRKIEDPDEKARKINLDKSQYYRPTGIIVFDEITYPLLYDGGSEKSEIDEEEPTSTDVRQLPSSVIPIIGSVGQNLIPSSKLDSIKYSKPIGGDTKDDNESDTPSLTLFDNLEIPPAITTPVKINDGWYTTIAEIWGYTGSMNGAMKKMLQGTSTDKKWSKGNLSIAITSDQMLKWATWYRKEKLSGNSKMNMLEDREKIKESIEGWYHQLKSANDGLNEQARELARVQELQRQKAEFNGNELPTIRKKRMWD